jgi:hypothetical protein
MLLQPLYKEQMTTGALYNKKIKHVLNLWIGWWWRRRCVERIFITK